MNYLDIIFSLVNDLECTDLTIKLKGKQYAQIIKEVIRKENDTRYNFKFAGWGSKIKIDFHNCNITAVQYE